MNQPQSAVLTVWLTLLIGTVSAQTVSPSVISTAGGLAANASGSLSYTVGEMAMIETFAGPTNFLTQGFQQPWELITAVHDDPLPVGLRVYPNPTDHYFYVRTVYDEPVTFRLNIINVFGQSVLQAIHEHTGKTTIQSVYAGHLPAGIYLVTLQPDNPLSASNLITTKIHITH